MADTHANFAVSLVATAPSPASSGTSLVVTSGEGTRFPAVPFNATICPAAADPTPANAEIVRVTAISTDTLTITRAQESSSARTVVVGDRIFAGATKKTFTDIELDLPWAAGRRTLTSTHYYGPTMGGTPDAGGTYAQSRMICAPFWCPTARTFDRIAGGVTAGNSAGFTLRLGIYGVDYTQRTNGIPYQRILDAGTVDASTTGYKEITISQALDPGLYWLAAVPQGGNFSIRRCNNQILDSGMAVIGQVCTMVYADSITGALPDPFTITGRLNATPWPFVQLRAA